MITSFYSCAHFAPQLKEKLNEFKAENSLLGQLVKDLKVLHALIFKNAVRMVGSHG